MDPLTSTFDPMDIDVREFGYFTDRVVGEAARQYALAEMVSDSDFQPVREYQRALSHMIGRLKRAHADIGKLEGHAHEWSENDYCMVCGADGRS